MTNLAVTFKVNQNEKYGDFRVDKYLDGKWVNQRDNNWSKKQAEIVAQKYRVASVTYTTMGDKF